MKRLATSKRTQVIAALVEGVSVNATCCLTGAAKYTVEIWAFCCSKDKNVPAEKRGKFGFGDVWTWTGIDSDSKRVISYLLGRLFQEDGNHGHAVGPALHALQLLQNSQDPEAGHGSG